MPTEAPPPAEAAAPSHSPAGETEIAAPEPTPAASTETAPETTTTTTTPEAPATTPAKGAVDAESYAELKRRALKGDTPPELLEKSAEAEPTPTETPKVAEATPVVAAAEATTTPPPEPDEEKTPERIRLTGLKDGHLVALANKLARDEGISFTEAFTRVSPKPTEATTTTAAATEQTPESLSELRTRIEGQIADAKKERKEAAQAQDNLEAGAALRMIAAEETLEGLREDLARIEYSEGEAETARENAEQAKFQTSVSESQAKAVQYWPEAADGKSELSKRTLELADEYEKDPNLIGLTREANSPFYFVQMAAQQLGLAPVHLRKKNGATAPAAQPSTSTATKPAPINQRAVGRPTQPAASPASGAARTTQETPEDKLGLEKIRSPYDYSKLVGSLTGQRR